MVKLHTINHIFEDVLNENYRYYILFFSSKNSRRLPLIAFPSQRTGVGVKLTNTKPVSIKKKVEVLQNAESFFKEKKGMYSISDLRKYLDELKALVPLIEKKIETAQEKVSENKPDIGPRPQV
jgi:hypothetical protein